MTDQDDVARNLVQRAHAAEGRPGFDVEAGLSDVLARAEDKFYPWEIPRSGLRWPSITPRNCWRKGAPRWRWSAATSIWTRSARTISLCGCCERRSVPPSVTTPVPVLMPSQFAPHSEANPIL